MNDARHAAALLETLLVEGGIPRHLDRHLARMAKSAAAFGWSFVAHEFDRAVEDALAEAAILRARLRLLLSPQGSCIAALLPLGPAPEQIVLALSPRTVHSADPLSRHKVLPRDLYDTVVAEAEAQGAWDGLLLNERGEVAETGRASVVALLRGSFLTPPLGAGILEGVTRGLLLERGAVREERFSGADLDRAEGLFVVNALVGAAAVKAVSGWGGYSPERSALARGRAHLHRALTGGVQRT